MTSNIRKLTLAYLASTAILVVSYFVTPAYLPVELQVYLDHQWDDEISIIEIVGACLVLVILLVHLFAAVGLIFVKGWARKAFLYSTFSLFMFLPFTGPAVDHAISYTIDGISVMIMGMIIGLLLFTDDYQQVALNKALKRIP